MQHHEIAPSYRVFQREVEARFKPVRARPGMYMGGVGAIATGCMIEAVVDHALVEAQQGYCNRIAIVLGREGAITVEDNGRGMPTEVDAITGISPLESVLTQLDGRDNHPSAGGRYRVLGGTHGVGIAVVNALSQWLTIVVQRDGLIFRQDFVSGVPQAPVRVVGSTVAHGTQITFSPDSAILHGPYRTADDYHYEPLDDRFRELAYLNSGIAFDFRDERPGKLQEHRRIFVTGLVEFVRFLNRSYLGRLLDPIRLEGEFSGGVLEVALQYMRDVSETQTTILSFVNNVVTSHGGTHVSGFRTGLVHTFNRYMQEHGLSSQSDDPITEEQACMGLTAVLSVRLDSPQFEGALRDRLGNTTVCEQVKESVARELTRYLDAHPEQAQALVQRF